MRFRFLMGWLFLLSLILGVTVPAGRGPVLAAGADFAPAADTTAYELIAAVNSVRVSNGLPALIEDGIINAVAQSTAETMAASQMSWHIGDVRGRLAAAGYGGGATVWATENFATGNYAIDEIMVIWSDADHMIPMVNPAYCHVGAGVARSSNGRNYYILQAAYTSSKSCGEYRPPGGSNPGTGAGTGANTGVSQLIAPVKLATPDIDGRIFHEVASGQSLWAIAIAYQVTIRDLETWNNISKDVPLKVGQKLFIPGSNTEGYATPTPVGMVQLSEAGADGRIYHIVQPYQALFSIAQAYKVSVDSILALNGIQKDWPLQIGQKLLISTGGDSPAPAGKLSPVQQLTPDADGNYYHTVKSGETLYWIARLYEINLYDLMNWNGLNEASVLRPEQRLVLLVTPPATATSTLAATVALPEVQTSPSPAASRSSELVSSPTPNNASKPPGNSNNIGIFGFVLIAMATGGLLLFVFSVKKR